jgi:hypothetical protein
MAWQWHLYALEQDPFLSRGGKSVWGEGGVGAGRDSNQIKWCMEGLAKTSGGGIYIYIVYIYIYDIYICNIYNSKDA